MLMLETKFAGFLKPGLPLRLDDQHVTDGTIEYASIVDLYGTRYHTNIRRPFDKEELIVRERNRLALLARTFIEDLENGEKIFVLKRNAPLSRHQVEALCKRMRTYGPATLLWVVRAEPGSPAGQIEWLSEGLMQGRIDHFADGLPFDADLCGWREVCRGALALRDRGS
jgi:hypothetical protein